MLYGRGHAINQGAIQILSDVSIFTRWVVGVPLRGYQVRPLRPVIRSILGRQGCEFLLIFPRQSGKNEAVAQLLVYLMNLYQRTGGNIVYGARGQTSLQMAIDRLDQRLDNPWNRYQWVKRVNPPGRCLGQAQVLFLSTHPAAATRGHTAHRLLVIDETQDQPGSQIEAVFTPMRAANNATALYIGTVKTTSDYLWQKKRELEAAQREDGQQRVFLVGPHHVAREVPDYELFLWNQVKKHGRHHPIVASEYFLEPIDASGGLFPPERRLQMRGFHRRGPGPLPGRLYVATVDVAGEDEAATDPVAQLERPGRDYTVATVFEVVFPEWTRCLPESARDSGALGTPQLVGALPERVRESGGRHEQGGSGRGESGGRPGQNPVDPVNPVDLLPTYRAVDVFVDQGSKHFASADDGPRAANYRPSSIVDRRSLAQRLRAWLEGWGVAHVVADASGVGQGLVSWLQAALGPQRVTAYQFSRPAKAALGSAFVALVETGRFQYWTGDEDQVLSDGWWFWRQVEACGYEMPPDGQFERDLRWEVPPGHRTDTPAGSQPTHDDRLVSAALVSELDRLYRAGRLGLGVARSSVIEGTDPLGGRVY